ncbi:uncharacterized protein G2W53_018172 [Senna tora]|uniref:Uncharacterized protein n=1 Tax=Senna tora TaxID=362788 RepID=A0A834TQU5_9FABA|nr:uncharacterized protein G2W53_018172 [Senna tora]
MSSRIPSDTGVPGRLSCRVPYYHKSPKPEGSAGALGFTGPMRTRHEGPRYTLKGSDVSKSSASSQTAPRRGPLISQNLSMLDIHMSSILGLIHNTVRGEQFEGIVGTLKGSVAFWHSGTGGRYGTSKEIGEGQRTRLMCLEYWAQAG